MVTLREMREVELQFASEMEEQSHARDFVLPTSLEQHQKNFANPNQVYLSIVTSSQALAGYFILHRETESKEVEFRRIVIDENHHGTGQQAIALMEAYCRDVLECERIWLDVFDDNARGIHIYEKLGYLFERKEHYQGRQLRFYAKRLQAK